MIEHDLLYIGLWVGFGMFGIMAAVCFVVQSVLTGNEGSMMSFGLGEEEVGISMTPDTSRQWGSESYVWDNAPSTGIRSKIRRT